MPQAQDIVLQYHDHTKHQPERYAKAPASIDWDDQPDPFRRFSGCKIITLPKPGAELDVLFANLGDAKKVLARPANLESIGLLLELAFGLSAWKEFGSSRWPLRCNPSSGNLHPTEAYLINTDATLMNRGVYHYVSHDHSLEQRAEFYGDTLSLGIFLGLSSLHWREAWKYGERAFRYCQHDIGHALGALRYAAACLGWTVELQSEYADADLTQLLGLDRNDDFKTDERETADVLCRIDPFPASTSSHSDALLATAQSVVWFGKANSLRAYHMYRWPIIDEVSRATCKPNTQKLADWQPTSYRTLQSPCTKTATQIIRQRRSAQQFDGKMSPMPLNAFYQIMTAALPTNPIPFDCWQWPPKVHLFIFVHRVEGLAPGLYSLLRDEQILPTLRSATLSQFVWKQMSKSFPFYQLYTGDLKLIAKTLSCHQPIASDSAFTLAMVAEFSESINAAPWQYRCLFWECGLIGQVLYLEAEAAGFRGTGIGCYFDDSVHEILGIQGQIFQSLYHFTVGKSLEDARLQTLPAYAHL